MSAIKPYLIDVNVLKDKYSGILVKDPNTGNSKLFRNDKKDIVLDSVCAIKYLCEFIVEFGFTTELIDYVVNSSKYEIREHDFYGFDTIQLKKKQEDLVEV